MKKILFSLAFLSLTSWAFAQKKGIKFEDVLSWREVKAKAKVENKYIFVEIYATWCGPCRAMDADVYSSEKVGAFMNDKFISVKVQADTSKKDDENTKKRYGEAHQIITQNRVKSLPTYLFFSPEGKIVDRGTGYKDVDALIQVAKDILRPEKQYYTLLERYAQNNKSYHIIPDLIRKARSLEEDSVAQRLINDYWYNYLDGLPDKELFTKENIIFATSESGDLFTSNSRIFQFIYKNPDKANEIIGDERFAESVICWRITKEELYNKLWQKDNRPISKQPNWNKMKASIERKYSIRYSDSLITHAQFLFYQIEKDWLEYVKLTEAVIKKCPPSRNGKNLSNAIGGTALMGPGNDAWGLNGIAWTLFQNTANSIFLKKALIWSDLSIKLGDPKSRDAHQSYDTKANILYKLGRVKEAIEYEKKGLEVLKQGDHDFLYTETYVKKYNEVILKMANGEKTWDLIATKN